MMNNKFLGKRIATMLGIVVFVFALTTACSSDDGDGDDNGGGGVVPTIADFSPKEGESGTSVTITGTNLSGATKATVNGTDAPITANTGTSVTITIPEGATPGPIIVATPGGAAKTTESFNVIVIGSVTITEISSRTVEVGDEVTITGTDMNTVTAVKVGGVDANAIEVVSDSELKFTVGASPLGLSKIEIVNKAGSLVTDTTVETFYVIERFVFTTGDKGTYDTFDDPEHKGFSTGGDAEIVSYGRTDGLDFSELKIEPMENNQMTDVPFTSLAPKAIDGKYFYIAGFSDAGDSGSYAGQIGTSSLEGAYAPFFPESNGAGNANLNNYYFNIQIHFGGVPEGYNDVLGESRLRFDEGTGCSEGSSNEFMVYKFVEADLQALGFMPNADGWYSISIPFASYVTEKCGSWDDYAIENVKRYNVAARRVNADAGQLETFSLSIDNVFLSKGGPVYIAAQ